MSLRPNKKNTLSKDSPLNNAHSSVQIHTLEMLIALYKKTGDIKPESQIIWLEGLKRVFIADIKPESQIILLEGLKRVFRADYFNNESQNIISNLAKATSKGQLQSKQWILDVLREKNQQDLGVVFLCAGWYGFLAFLFLNQSFFKIKNIFLFEIDPLSVFISEDLNRIFVKNNWRFKASLKNIMDINYQKDCFKTLRFNGDAEELTVSPDTIINTSCEHMLFFSEWWKSLPKNKLIILQSNNYFALKEHINCVSSLEEFKKMASMDFIYEGSLEFPEYQRFMLIGYKS